MNTLFQETAFQEFFILRQAVKLILQAMGRYQSAYPLQLGLTKEKGKDGDEQVQFRHPDDLQSLWRRILDELKEKSAGMILVPNGVVDKGKVKRAMANACLKVESLRKVLSEKGQIGFLKVADGNEIDIRHEGKLFLQTVFFDLVVKGHPIDLEDLRRPGDVPIRLT